MKCELNEQTRVRDKTTFCGDGDESIVRVIKSRRMRLVMHVARVGENIVVYRVLVGKPEGKRPLGRHQE
jgi:hypothetical protein